MAARIRVGVAEEGMTFTTLDGQDRVLTARDLLIWDDERPRGFGWVMGGANSGDLRLEFHRAFGERGVRSRVHPQDGSSSGIVQRSLFPFRARRTRDWQHGGHESSREHDG